TEKGHGSSLSLKPRKSKEGILYRNSVRIVVIMSSIMVLVTFAFFTQFEGSDLTEARTLAFLAMSFTQLFNALNLRSLSKSLFKIGIFSNRLIIIALIILTLLNVLVVYNPFLSKLLNFTYVKPELFVLVILASSLTLW